jgi:hypothetical protein
LIEKAYTQGEKMSLAVWVEDEAGPYQTAPYPGESWQLEGHPARQPHEYIRNGTAKMLTFFHPVSGEVRIKGVRQATNAILHPWFKEQLSEILKEIPEANLGPRGQPKTMDLLAGRLITADHFTRTTPAFADAFDLGQSEGASYPRDGLVVI